MKIYCLIICVVISTAFGASPCTTNNGKIAHPDECQLYYDCSRPGSGVGRVFEPNLYECEYPDVFDAQRLKCGDYHTVNCGSRKVIKDICETKKYRDAHAHGRPCHVDHLNCDGLPDGKHPFPYMLNSPYYAKCEDGRFKGKYTCRNSLGEVTMFNPGTKECEGRDDN